MIQPDQYMMKEGILVHVVQGLALKVGAHRWFLINSWLLLAVLPGQAQSDQVIQDLENKAELVQYDSLERAAAYNQLVAIYYNRDLQKARRYHRRALRLLTQVPPSLERGRAYLNEAQFRYGQGQYAAAIEQALQAQKVADAHQNAQLANATHALLGLIYSTKGYVYEGTKYSLMAKSNMRELKRSPELGLPYYQVGTALIMLNDTARALTCFRLAMNEQVRAGQDYLIGLVDVERGLWHIQRREWAKAQVRLDRALQQSQAQNNIRGVAYANYALGLLHSLQQFNEEAIDYFGNAKDTYDRLEDNLSVAKVLKGMAMVALDQTNYDKAEQYLKDALQRARRSNARVMVQNIYSDLYKIAREAERYEEAMGYQEMYHAIKDTIQNNDKIRAIAEIQSKYRMQELERENEELEISRQLNAQQLRNEELRNESFTYVVAALGAGLVLMLIIGILVFRQNKLNNRIRVKGLEQKALRAQMNPHFLFNSLNSIQSLIATDRNAEASIYLAKFSRLMRRILQNSRQAFITLDQEMEFLDSYIELEQRRFTEVFEYEIQEAVEDSHFVMIQPMVIQPFIENAIIHGLLRQSKKGKLSVRFEEFNDQLIRCVIEDNGIGRAAAAAFKTDEKQESLGVKITEQRLQQFMKDKNAGPAVRYVDLTDAQGQAAGTRVEVLLPIKYKA